MLKEILSSEFIVEIMDKNNAGITLRTLEAICYNRKLVTDMRKYFVLHFIENKIFIC